MMSYEDDWNDGHGYGAAAAYLRTAAWSLERVEYTIAFYDDNAPDGSHSTFLADYRDRINDAIAMLKEAHDSTIEPPDDGGPYVDDDPDE